MTKDEIRTAAIKAINRAPGTLVNPTPVVLKNKHSFDGIVSSFENKADASGAVERIGFWNHTHQTYVIYKIDEIESL